jgi:Zn-finger nucleic acid-binding protein
LGDLHCPRDRSPLINIVDLKQEHIEQNACTVCGGILLDAGELRDLSEFTLSERVKAVFAKFRK